MMVVLISSAGRLALHSLCEPSERQARPVQGCRRDDFPLRELISAREGRTLKGAGFLFAPGQLKALEVSRIEALGGFSVAPGQR